MAGHWIRSIGFRPLRVSCATWVSLALVLAVGVGANVAVLSVLYTALVGSRPYEASERLVVVENIGAYHLGTQDGPAFDMPEISAPDFHDIAAAGTFACTGGMTAPEKVFTSSADRTVSATRVFVTAELFKTVQAKTILGRALDERDFQTSSPAVVVLTDTLWRRVAARDSAVIGRLFRVDGQPMAVVGVVSDDTIRFLRQRQGLLDDDDDGGFAVVPLTPNAEGSNAARLTMRRENRDSPMLTVVARLNPNATARSARETLRSLSRRLANEYPASNTGRSLAVSLLSEWRNPQLRPLRTMLLAVGLLTLLVAGASACNWVTADAIRRSSEMAIRWALGGTSTQLTRLFIAPTIVWTLPAAALSVVVAAWTLAWVGRSDAETSTVLRLSFEPRLLGMALALTIATGAALGVVARSTIQYRNLASHLHEAAPVSSAGRRRGLVFSVLLCAQVAASTSVGFVSGLLLRSMSGIAAVDLGYKTESRFVVPIGFTQESESYQTAAEQRAFLDRAVARVRALPNVVNAGVSAAPPLSNFTVTARGALGFEVPDRVPEALAPLVVQFVSSGYLEALGVHVIHGRLISDVDYRTTAPVVVIDEAFWRARHVVGNPLTAAVRYGRWRLRVVGVIGPLHQSGPTEKVVPTIYIPATFRQSAARLNFVVVEPSGSAPQAMQSVVRELAALDPLVCIDEPRTFASLLSRTIVTRQRTMRLLTLDATIVLLLTIFSVAGSLGQFVENRKRDIAIRKALGAQWLHTAMLLGRQIGVPGVAGLAIGWAGSWSLARLVSNQLFGVDAADPLVAAATVCGLVILGLLAAALPMWRAGRVDAVLALRAQ